MPSEALLARLRAVVAGPHSDFGSECRVFLFGSRFVIKAYPTAAERDFAFARQTAAYRYGIAPATFVTFEAPGLFCYVSVRVLPDLVRCTPRPAVRDALMWAYEDLFGEQYTDFARRNFGWDEFDRPVLIDFGVLSIGDTRLFTGWD